MNDAELIAPIPVQPPKVRRPLDELDTMRRVDDLLQAQEHHARLRILNWVYLKNRAPSGQPATLGHVSPCVDEDDGA